MQLHQDSLLYASNGIDAMYVSMGGVDATRSLRTGEEQERVSTAFAAYQEGLAAGRLRPPGCAGLPFSSNPRWCIVRR